MELRDNLTPTITINETGRQVPRVIGGFQEIFQRELEIDERRYGVGVDFYAHYRALTQTFLSRNFRELDPSNDDIRILIDFFLTDKNFREPFESWVKNQDFWREQRFLPGSIFRICSIGKLEILRRNGGRK